MNKIIENTSIEQWVFISILLRLIVMPFTVHGDIYHIAQWPHFIAHGDWDVFGLAERAGINYYAPFLAVFMAGYQFIITAFSPGVEGFIHNLNDSLFSAKIALQSEYLFQSLTLLKLPYLIFDLILIWICLNMLTEEHLKKGFLIYWALNPIVIYSTFMMGQCDIMAGFFTILACHFSLQKGKEKYACLSIALGTLFKIFPIIFFPLVLCISSKSAKDFFWLSLYGILPVVAVYGLFYFISGDAVFKVFDVAGGYSKSSTQILDLFWRLTQASLYALVCYHAFFIKKNKLDYSSLFQYFLVVYLAIYLGFNYYSTHHISWFIPFLILYVIQHPAWKWPYYLLMIIVFLATLKARSMCFGIFAPLNPKLFNSLPALKDVVGYFFNVQIYYMTVNIFFKGLIIVLLGSVLLNLFFHNEKREVKAL